MVSHDFQDHGKDKDLVRSLSAKGLVGTLLAYSPRFPCSFAMQVRFETAECRSKEGSALVVLFPSRNKETERVKASER